LKSDYKSENAPVVGTELIGTSISSGADSIDHAPNVLPQLAENPIKFYDNQRGYLSCEMTPKSRPASESSRKYRSPNARSPHGQRSSSKAERQGRRRFPDETLLEPERSYRVDAPDGVSWNHAGGRGWRIAAQP
jgi:hypothetical protein